MCLSRGVFLFIQVSCDFDLVLTLKETRNFYFCVTHQKLDASRVYTKFPQISQKTLTTYAFHWLELIFVILSHLQMFSLRNTFFLNTSENLQENQQKNYISGNLKVNYTQYMRLITKYLLFLTLITVFIYLVSYFHIRIYHCFIYFAFIFPFFLTLIVTGHIPQFTTFDLVSLQPAFDSITIFYTERFY